MPVFSPLQTCNMSVINYDNYKKNFSTLVKEWPSVCSAFLGPLHTSAYSNAKARFAYYALSSGIHFAKHQFNTNAARSVFAGMAAHSMLPLNKLTTSSIAIVLNILAHINGWPLPKGGAQQITNALAACFFRREELVVALDVFADVGGSHGLFALSDDKVLGLDCGIF